MDIGTGKYKLSQDTKNCFHYLATASSYNYSDFRLIQVELPPHRCINKGKLTVFCTACFKTRAEFVSINKF